MNLKELHHVIGGELSSTNAVFNSVSIDTRSLVKNELFIAISGPNFNGNNYVAEAKEKMACAAIVSETVNVDLPMIKVKDTRIAFGKIAAKNRDESKACVIALTGSQGKTTVKEMTAEILSHSGEVISTKGNLNNDFGVPLSLLQINSQHQYAVIELGASGAGEIDYTVQLTKPKIVHITNVAATHIEGFGDIDGVSAAKSEIFKGLDKDGIGVINIDDVYANDWIKLLKDKKIVKVSAKGNKLADYFIDKIETSFELKSKFRLNCPNGKKEIILCLPGKHNIENALAAAAMSMEAGASLEDVKLGLENIKPVQGRFCPLEGINQSTIIDDSYNASPASFKAAIESISQLPGKKIIAMGDMSELGKAEEELHRDIGVYAKQNNIEYLFSKGKLSRFAGEGFGEGYTLCADIDQLTEEIKPLLGKSTTVLIKGSRSAGMEKLVKQLVYNKVEI